MPVALSCIQRKNLENRSYEESVKIKVCALIGRKRVAPIKIIFLRFDWMRKVPPIAWINRKNVGIKWPKAEKTSSFLSILTMACPKILLCILAIFLPPLAVALESGCCTCDFFLNLLLTLLGFIPGKNFLLLIPSSYKL